LAVPLPLDDRVAWLAARSTLLASTQPRVLSATGIAVAAQLAAAEIEVEVDDTDDDGAD